MSNGENIAMMIGLCQLFELYSKCSLTAQHSRKFPTSILEELMSLINELQDLSQKWTWQKEQLNFSCFGKPFEIMSEMVLEGLYKPKTSKSSCTRSQVKHSIYEKRACEIRQSFQEQGMEEEEVDELLHFNSQIETSDISNSNNEIPIEGFTIENKEKVEQQLSSVAHDLEKNLKERVKNLKMIEAALQAFGGSFQWLCDSLDLDESEANNRLKALFESMGTKAESFCFDDCFVGYLIYLKFIQKKILKGESPRPLESLYKQFFSEKGQTQLTKSFIVLFQFVQVKSYSEAICETVGSLMKIHGGRGRNLHPINFSKELCLKFNLPPLHIMKLKFIP